MRNFEGDRIVWGAPEVSTGFRKDPEVTGMTRRGCLGMLRGWWSFVEFWRGAGVAPAACRGFWGANTPRVPGQVLPHDPGQGAAQLLGTENEGEAGEEAGPGSGTAAGGSEAEGEGGNAARELENSRLSQAPSRVSALIPGVGVVAEHREKGGWDGEFPVLVPNPGSGGHMLPVTDSE